MNEEKEGKKHCIKERAAAKVKCYFWGTMKGKLAKKEAIAPLPLLPPPRPQAGQPPSRAPCCWQILRGSQKTKGKGSSKSPCPEITKLVGLELEDNSFITNTEI